MAGRLREGARFLAALHGGLQKTKVTGRITLALTATATRRVVGDIIRQLGMRKPEGFSITTRWASSCTMRKPATTAVAARTTRPQRGASGHAAAVTAADTVAKP